MNEDNLSKRLTLVAEQIPSGSRLADIGSDHAYLPCFALRRGLVSSAIAGEVNEGPFQSAVEQVKKLNYEDKIYVKKGNGLEVISAGEVDVITIAGMGGPLIASILNNGKDKLEGVKRLVLQPNVAANQIRVWLEANDWLLINELILEEDGIIYEILVAERTGPNPYHEQDYQTELLLGPFLMKEKNDAFKKKWTNEVGEWKKILSQFEKAKQTEEVLIKKQDLIERITRVEEVIQ
ncbi:tRNA (adenine-N(1))-methyltransferase [Anaerobacillus alkaliphilus]|uniref:tRNA (Adenine-N(1))-methyltransferase n=1 Tax=Anaerobacillus alkaliphilus TaxID=1548597 RepID=A0A4V1LG77_9BACI|nr:tRNA (adenine(22)-N(1))-methyltransferase TrmK [Anaerobacillus alkaliphilus]RXI99418.1 tRNA (adenine-N(1))-methyltransferase [Anaerobacillus alkaliphilus]